MLLISACLLGAKVKYNGSSNYCTLLAKYKNCGLFIPICPECLGQLTIPRLPAEITGSDGSDVLNGTAKVYDNAGYNVTENFIKGAEAALEVARRKQIKFAVLKARSPSCSTGKIYNGNFNGTLMNGDGVTSALLKQNGITVYTELDLTEELLNELLVR